MELGHLAAGLSECVKIVLFIIQVKVIRNGLILSLLYTYHVIVLFENYPCPCTNKRRQSGAAKSQTCAH